MLQAILNDPQKSEKIRTVMIERLEKVMERFPDLKKSPLTVSMSRESRSAGPEIFKVKVRCGGGRYGGLSLELAAPNLQKAISSVFDRMAERLKKVEARKQKQKRTRVRRIKKQMLTPEVRYEAQSA